MENVPNSRGASRPENVASGDGAPQKMGSMDAQDREASINDVAFGNSLLFPDNTIDLRDPMLSLITNDTEVALPESPPLPFVSQGVSYLVTKDKVSGSEGCADIQWVGLLEELSDPPEKETPSPTTATTASMWKGKKKQELEYLRAHVKELESELGTLKAAYESPSALVEPSAWERVAKRQSEARRKAVIENAKLRKLLEGQLKVARSLEKLLNKRALCEPDSQFTKRKRISMVQAMDVDAVRDEIRSRIHEVLDSMDTVMDECGLSLFYTDMEDVRVTSSAAANDSVCMEMVILKVLPFPFDQVAKAQWECTTADYIDFENGSFGASSVSEWLCDVEYTSHVQLRRAEAVLHLAGVGARRMEEDRCFIVFESVGTTRGSLFAENPVQSRERTYILLEKNLAANENDPPSTLLKVCTHLWPENEESDGENVPGNVVVRSFIDLIIGSYNQNVMTVTQLVENTLLEQSLKS